MFDLLDWLAAEARPFLDPSGPKGWSPLVVWSYTAGSAAVGSSFLALAALLGAFVRRRRDLGSFRRTFRLFLLLCLMCGATSWSRIFLAWSDFPEFVSLFVVATGATGIATVWSLMRSLQEALRMRSPTELLVMAEELRLDRERAWAGFRGSPVPLHSMTPDGTIIDVSDRWLRLLGYTREEAEQTVVGRPWWFLHAQPAEAKVGLEMEELRRGGEVQDRPRTLVRRDGTHLAVEVSKRLERGLDGNEYVVCAVVDVTGRREAEAALTAAQQRLAQANKMEAIGQITGGVAHDFNNMLQAVGGNLKLLLTRIEGGAELDRPRMARQAQSALDACGHAARLTSQLLSFARKQPLNPEVFDPVAAVEGMKALIEASAGHPVVALRWDMEPPVGTAFADQTQLSNALLNLVANARDALGSRQDAEIRVLVKAHRLGPGAGPDAPPPGDYIRITVQDNGCGMSPEVAARATEPFFTTKDVGKGTGLGLASVHGFARQSGGTVAIESARGAGSKVSILLPRHGDEGAARPRAPAEERLPRGNGECVLVVEDVEAVREVLAEQLDMLGYGVIQAENADRAVDVLRQKGHGIHAVLTDMMMPGSMDGLELCGLIRNKWETIPVALMTGNLDAPRGARLPEGVLFMAKPYPLAELAKMLRRMLELEDA